MALADAHYVDCARNDASSVATSSVTYDGGVDDPGVSATFTQGISVDGGLDHLEGETVSILADGSIQAQQTVTSGTITEPGGTTHVGLPYEAQLQPMKIDEVLDFQQRIVKTYTSFLNSVKASAGLATDDVDEVEFSTTGLNTETVEIPFNGKYGQDGDLFITDSNPTPLTVLSHYLEVTAND